MRYRYGTVEDGSRNTIHASTELNIEVDDDGRPAAVWFRCLTLPFTVWRRDNGEPVYVNPDDMKIQLIEYEDSSE